MNKKPVKVDIKRDNTTKKKMVAIFYDKEGKKVKTTRFGADGYSDFTKNKDPERKKRYLKRHAKEKGGVMTASTLAKDILWNKPTLKASISNYKQKYNLK
tara:strand:+ start:4078 stop:4377 length:300 start_codon:yes stop_codon:yes gene_type:complete